MAILGALTPVLGKRVAILAPANGSLGHLPAGIGQTDHLPAQAGVQAWLQALLHQQDAGPPLTPAERQEAAGLVALAELHSLLHPRAQRPAPPP